MRKWLILLTPLFLVGCQTWGPTWSELSGARQYNLTTMHRLPAIIVSVDDRGSFPSRPIKVEPGRHEIRLQGTQPGWHGATEETIVLTLDPCKRYYLNAQYTNSLQPRFTPVVDYVETIPGCKVVAAAN